MRICLVFARVHLVVGTVGPGRRDVGDGNSHYWETAIIDHPKPELKYLWRKVARYKL